MKKRVIAAVLGLASTVGALPLTAAHAATPEVTTVLTAARQATQRYHDVSAALADGYVPVTGCVELPGVGGMGIHYLNPARAADRRIVPDQPEELLYAPAEGGGLKLVGVEYFMADADQNPSTDDDRPSLAGIPFDGPMLGHAPGMPVHYDLHVWAWRANPTGTFQEWNPLVHC